MKKEPSKFRKWCKENKLTAAVVAERIGCTKRTVYAYFQGERLPNRRTEKRMQEVLGIDTREMFGR